MLGEPEDAWEIWVLLITQILVLHSPLLPSLSPVPHACVVHMSLGGCQGLGDNVCFTTKHTCFPQPAKLFSCWLLGWMLISLQTSCLHSFSFCRRKNPFSLSLSLLSSPPLPISLPLSFSPSRPSFFSVGICSHFIKVMLTLKYSPSKSWVVFYSMGISRP